MPESAADDELPSLAKRLRRIRAERQLTQEDMARMAKAKVGAYGRWENGETQPRADHIRSLCVELNISSDFLLNLTENEDGLRPGKVILNLEALEAARRGEEASWAYTIPARAKLVTDGQAKAQKAAIDEGGES